MAGEERGDRPGNQQRRASRGPGAVTWAPEETTRRLALRSLASPWSVGAILVLMLNDHILKASWPGWFTGKLSDFAGMVFFPLLVAAVVSRRRPEVTVWPLWTGVILTGALFSAINVSPRAVTAIESAMAGLGVPWQVTADPTDLMALPMLAAPMAIWRRSRSRSTLRDRRPFEMVVLLAAAGASIATSCVDAYPAVWAVEADGRALVAYTDDRTYMSIDGGGSWSEVSVRREDLPPRAESSTMACFENDPDHCFRLISPLTVEETGPDGEWTTAFHISSERVDYMQRSFTGGCSDYVVDVTDIAISDGGDPIVVVAAGDTGLLVRQPDGAWDRGVLPRWTVAPVADVGRGPTFEVSAAWGIAALSAMIVASVAARRMVPGHGTRDGFWWGAARLTGVSGAAGVALLGSGFLGTLAGQFLSLGMLPALVGFGRLVFWLPDAVGRRHRPLRFMAIALIPLAGGLVSHLIWLLWRAAVIESYAVAQPLANLTLGLAAVGAVAAVLLMEPPVVLAREQAEGPVGITRPPSRDEMGAVTPEFWKATLVGFLGTIAWVVSNGSIITAPLVGVVAGLLAVAALAQLAARSGLPITTQVSLVALPPLLALVTAAAGLGPNDYGWFALVIYAAAAAWMVPSKRRGVPRRLRRLAVLLLALPVAYMIAVWLLVRSGGAILPIAFLAAVLFAEDRPPRPETRAGT